MEAPLIDMATWVFIKYDMVTCALEDRQGAGRVRRHLWIYHNNDLAVIVIYLFVTTVLYVNGGK